MFSSRDRGYLMELEPFRRGAKKQSMDEIKDQIRQFLYEILPKGKSSDLRDDTALRTSGIVDSMNLLRIVDFIEGKYGIQVEAYESDVDNFDRIQDIAAFVQRKQATTA
jgi:acyl carrier protein